MNLKLKPAKLKANFVPTQTKVIPTLVNWELHINIKYHNGDKAQLGILDKDIC